MATRSRYRPRHLDFFGRRFVIHGLPRPIWHDLYHLFMTVSWPVLFTAFALFFGAINLLFAGVYAIRPDDIANLDPQGYWGLFFFSAETFATVGYGDMHPRTPFSHSIATLENFVGLTSLALITGMMFARFSRPTARILFARHGVIRPFDGARTLILRVANARANIIVEASASLRLIRDDVTVEGTQIRRIYDLPLRRSQQPAFLFGWNLMHVIDAASPLAGANDELLEATKTFLILTIIGTDETTGQVLMARERYAASALHWDHSFVDILHTDENGVDHFDYTKFDEVQALQLPTTTKAIETPPQHVSTNRCATDRAPTAVKVPYAKKWQKEVAQLRKAVVECGLREQIKWGKPCFTYLEKNVAIVIPLKEACALSFFKGVLLKDPKGILQKIGQHTQAGRWIKFASLKEIKDVQATLKNYIREAIRIEESGETVTRKKASAYAVPEELQAVLNAAPELQAAFEGLTPGRRKSYIFHISQAKQAKTRTARAQRCIPKIFEWPRIQRADRLSCGTSR